MHSFSEIDGLFIQNGNFLFKQNGILCFAINNDKMLAMDEKKKKNFVFNNYPLHLKMMSYLFRWRIYPVYGSRSRKNIVCNERLKLMFFLFTLKLRIKKRKF